MGFILFYPGFEFTNTFSGNIVTLIEKSAEFKKPIMLSFLRDDVVIYCHIIYYVQRIFVSEGSLRNPGAKYAGNKIPRRFQNFLVCPSNTLAETTAEDSAETLCQQWFRHTSAFCHRLSFGFLIVETTCSA